MTLGSRSARFVVAVVVAALVAAACGGDDDDGFDVVTDVVSHETTPAIHVWAPDAEGSWPLVYALHGVGGKGQDMAEVAQRVAASGAVVFAPSYHTDMTTEPGAVQAVTDAECSYRFARTLAADYGGDPDLPVTFVGFSLGASFVLEGGLNEQLEPWGGFIQCFDLPPRPEVIVAISGCHYEYEGQSSELNLSEWTNTDAAISLVAGEDDEICEAWQSEDAAAELEAAGFAVELVMLEGADHFAPIFHDVVDGEWVVVPDALAGEQTVEVIVDAIAEVPR